MLHPTHRSWSLGLLAVFAFLAALSKTAPGQSDLVGLNLQRPRSFSAPGPTWAQPQEHRGAALLHDLAFAEADQN